MSETGDRGGAINRIRNYIEGGAFETELAARVAHRTESQKLPDSLPHLHSYLEDEMVPAFEAMGFTIKRYDNPVSGQAPAILATRLESSTLPTVLGYGHGDVIRGLDNQWTKGKGPWITARDGDRLYGRGTA